MKKRIHKALFISLLLGVYGVFFSVESFYNFEGQTSARDLLRYATQISHQANGTTVARTTPLHSSSSHTIRLNKRYHQEDIPPCPVLSPALPEVILQPLVLNWYRSAELPLPALLHRPLRGPPALA